MARHGYVDDYDFNYWDHIRWRGAVESAIRGRRGQSILREMLEIMEALPPDEQRLIKGDLEKPPTGERCALGVVGHARGVDMTLIDVEDYNRIAEIFGIASALAQEIMYVNDDGTYARYKETPEQRFDRVVEWLKANVKPFHPLVTPDRDF